MGRWTIDPIMGEEKKAIIASVKLRREGAWRDLAGGA